MKKTLIILFLASTTFLTQAYACSCVSPNFEDSDINRDIENFMQAKRSIPSSQLILINNEDTEYYVPRLVRGLVNLFSLGEEREYRDQIRACELDCISWHHQKRSYNVQYFDGSSQCSQQLFIKVRSNTFNDGYKITIKKKTHPVCN